MMPNNTKAAADLAGATAFNQSNGGLVGDSNDRRLPQSVVQCPACGGPMTAEVSAPALILLITPSGRDYDVLVICVVCVFGVATGTPHGQRALTNLERLARAPKGVNRG